MGNPRKQATDVEPEENRRHKGERKGSTLVFSVGVYLYVDTRIAGTGHYVTWSTTTTRHDTT